MKKQMKQIPGESKREKDIQTQEGKEAKQHFYLGATEGRYF